MKTKIEIAVFGGGCFWCTEAIFKMLDGVISVEPGYAGGRVILDDFGQERNPAYEEVSSGKTGYVEVIKIGYDPSQISFEKLLTVFFATHDPTTPDRQGSDVGAQYRSSIFYSTDAQKTEAEEFIEKINKSDPNGAPIVTEVRPLDKFYEAEEYHRDYYEKNKNNLYSQTVINPKLEKVKEKFSELLNNEK